MLLVVSLARSAVLLITYGVEWNLWDCMYVCMWVCSSSLIVLSVDSLLYL